MTKIKILLITACIFSTLQACSKDNDMPQPDKPDPVVPTGNADPFNECDYSPARSIFNLWCPDATNVELRLYADYSTSQHTDFAMQKVSDDVWQVTIDGDREGWFYTFRTFTDGKWNAETPGIFAKAVGVNGKRAAIIDLKTTDPKGWESDSRPTMSDNSRTVIYELHMRDISTDNASGISNKGKFLALTEEGTVTPDGLTTGLNHLKELGITHVQIMPATDFASIDETVLSQNKYNWGYEPINYNVPEGSYSTDPYSPEVRIREMKQMIKALHDNGIRVILDVVYNHTTDMAQCALGQVTPKYFYRYKADGTPADGSGCGNETASEKEMMRRFMVESVSYWAKEYHIDGFRFDLMAIHDLETMRQIRSSLTEIDPTILVYGEGWAASDPAYDRSLLAFKSNMIAVEGVGAFSDDIRDALVGTPFDNDGGFVTGKSGNDTRVKFGLVGGIYHQQAVYSTAWCTEPTQHISYVSCHDDLCLRDKLKSISPSASESELLRMDKLAQTAVMTSQGIPFIFCGEELFRTKQGIKDSYESPDEINQLDWSDKSAYHDLFLYYKGLISIRQTHPGFHLGSAAKVREHVEFPTTPDNQLIIYRIKDLGGIDPAKSLMVILNGSKTNQTVTIPDATYTILAHDGQIDPDGIETRQASEITVPAVSATILAEY